MKRFIPNGQRIKQLRESDVRGLKQKALADLACVSERKLRDIENHNDSVNAVTAKALGKALNVDWTTLIGQASDTKPTDASSAADIPAATEEKILIPRFDTTYARVVKDARRLIEDGQRSTILVSHILVDLNGETSGYADELLTLLELLVENRRNLVPDLTGRAEIAMAENLRRLLVLLKGNDVWVYSDSCFKHLPESYDLQPRDKVETAFQLIVAFGPPGEYGEDTLKVPVDNGQPWELPTKPIFPRSAECPT